jgi:hypothetical protein
LQYSIFGACSGSAIGTLQFLASAESLQQTCYTEVESSIKLGQSLSCEALQSILSLQAALVFAVRDSMLFAKYGKSSPLATACASMNQLIVGSDLTP